MTDTKWSEWINWAATGYSVCPLEDGTLSQVLFSSGDRACDNKCPEEWDWNDTGGLGTICAYRYEMSDVSISATWSGLITLAGRHDKADARMDNIARNGNDGEHYSDPKETDIWADAPPGADYYAAWSRTYYRIIAGCVWFMGDGTGEAFESACSRADLESLGFIKRPSAVSDDVTWQATDEEDEAFDAMANKAKIDLNRPLGDDITAYDPPGPTSMPECTFTTPDEDEAWREVEKKINPVWQSPHDFGGVCVFHGCRYSAHEQCYMCVLAGEAAKEEAKQPAYNPEDVAGVHSEAKQARYQDTAGEDWIDEAARTFTPEEFRGAMKFTIGKYVRRMGKKDSLPHEIEKIRDYTARWLKVEQGR